MGIIEMVNQLLAVACNGEHITSPRLRAIAGIFVVAGG